jgi:hypothetical protein
MNFIIIIIIIALIFIILLLHHSSNSTKDSYLDRIVNKIGSLSIVLYLIGIILTYRILLLTRSYNNMAIDFQYIDRLWLNINNLIANNYDKCPIFINSLFYDWQKNIFNINNNDINKNDNWLYINLISLTIFQSFNDYVLYISNDKYDKHNWINLFINWTGSDQLYIIWNNNKYNYHDKTVQFVDNLFYLTRTNRPKSTEDMKKLKLKIIASLK